MDEQTISEVVHAQGLDWDDGNRDKNKKHNVDYVEIEEVFFNPPFVILSDSKHSERESRYYCFGQSFNERKLLIVFTIRNAKIRAISARSMNAKERKYYEEKTNPKI